MTTYVNHLGLYEEQIFGLIDREKWRWTLINMSWAFNKNEYKVALSQGKLDWWMNEGVNEWWFV